MSRPGGSDPGGDEELDEVPAPTWARVVLVVVPFLLALLVLVALGALGE